jgi:hypothetical protein
VLLDSGVALPLGRVSVLELSWKALEERPGIGHSRCDLCQDLRALAMRIREGISHHEAVLYQVQCGADSDG